MDFKEFLTKNIFGKTFADRDFIFQMITDYLWNDDIHLLYKLKKNMKKHNISDIAKLLLE